MGIALSLVSSCRHEPAPSSLERLRGLLRPQPSQPQPQPGTAALETAAPDPGSFTILSVQQVGEHLVAGIQYDGATNYEGRKVLLYRDTTEAALRTEAWLDPHFCDDEHLSPFARFEPTRDGWVSAVECARALG